MAYGQIDSDKINTSVANTSLGAGNATRFKNRIINGDMRIDQRNAGAAVTAGGYNVDRWRLDTTSFGQAFSVGQNKNSVTPPAGFTNYLGIQMTTGVALTGNQLMTFDQVIEGYNIADLAWGTANAKAVTVSAWVYSSVTGTFSGSLVTNSYSYVFTYSIPVANTWTYVTATVPGLTAVSPTSITNGAGILVYFTFGGSGTYLTSTTNSWQSGAYYGVTGTANVPATTNATFYITGVQLEVGSSATGFEYVDYGHQLIQCQRYYQKFSGSSGRLGSLVGNGPYNGTASIFQMVMVLPVTMRAAPTVDYTNLGVYNNGVGSLPNFNTLYTAIYSPFSINIGWSGGSGGYGGVVYGELHVSTNGYFAVNAEL